MRSEAYVPANYHGVWRRSLLTTQSGTHDTSSHVYWLQTSWYHGDVRIPADRPLALRSASLATLDRTAMCELARQGGFVGITSIRGQRCQWHRYMDYRAKEPVPDIGIMHFEHPDLLLEDDVDGAYHEDWQRLPDSLGFSGCVLLEEEGSDTPRRAYLLIAGQYFMWVRDRRKMLPEQLTLPALVADTDVDETRLRELVDFETSFGRVNARGDWVISHSTLPWREGVSLLENIPPGEGAILALQTLGLIEYLDGEKTLRWYVREVY